MVNQELNKNKCLAAIDLGSNSFHCLIVDADNPLKVLAHAREAVQLRAGIDPQTGIVSKVTSYRTFTALKKFRSLLDEYGVRAIKAVGTQAFRMINPHDPFLESVNTVLQVPVEILSGLEEAYAIYRGVMGVRKDRQALKNHLVLDIGGGSTEIIYGRESKPLLAVSFPIGGVELMQRMPIPKEFNELCFEQLNQLCLDDMQKALRKFQGFNWDQAFLASGMAEVLVEIGAHFGLKEITPILLDDIVQCIVLRQIEPNFVPSLTQDRWSMLPSSVSILKVAMETLGVESIQASSGSLRHSLLIDLVPLKKSSQVA